jgi:hypothetical protein
MGGGGGGGGGGGRRRGEEGGKEEEKERNNISGGKAEGKRPLGRPRLEWVVTIKMNLGEIKWHGIY